MIKVKVNNKEDTARKASEIFAGIQNKKIEELKHTIYLQKLKIEMLKEQIAFQKDELRIYRQN